MTDILEVLKKLDEAHGQDIELWFAEKRQSRLPHFYTSVDLRHSGCRLVPVDTNLYPAGFNNLSPAARGRASRFIAHFLRERYPRKDNILIIPENHTRNLGYLENLAVLRSLFEPAGVQIRIGSLVAQPGEPIELVSPSGAALTEYAILREGNRLTLEDGFTPDVIILNNDMTAGVPDLFKELEQPIIPPPDMGWWQRRKSVHFDAYRELAEEFGARFGLDPWLLVADSQRCGLVDFKERTGLDKVAGIVENMLARMRGKYAEHGFRQEPYVYIKAESGTYGMGIMMVRDPGEILELNKKERNKMQVIKEGARNSDVIIQEGIPTADQVAGKPAEPMIYMIDGIPAGGMFRINGQRDAYGNLNAAGMEFVGMCDEVEDACHGEWHAVRSCHFRSYGIVAAMAALAAAREDYTTGTGGAGI